MAAVAAVPAITLPRASGLRVGASGGGGPGSCARCGLW